MVERRDQHSIFENAERLPDIRRILELVQTLARSRCPPLTALLLCLGAIHGYRSQLLAPATTRAEIQQTACFMALTDPEVIQRALEAWWSIPPRSLRFDSPFRSDRQWFAFWAFRILQLEDLVAESAR